MSSTAIVHMPAPARSEYAHCRLSVEQERLWRDALPRRIERCRTHLNLALTYCDTPDDLRDIAAHLRHAGTDLARLQDDLHQLRRGFDPDMVRAQDRFTHCNETERGR